MPYFIFWADAALTAACVAVLIGAYLYETIRRQRERMARRLQAPPVRVSIRAPWFGEGDR